jgi:hypothetical protein
MRLSPRDVAPARAQSLDFATGLYLKDLNVAQGNGRVLGVSLALPTTARCEHPVLAKAPETPAIFSLGRLAVAGARRAASSAA